MILTVILIVLILAIIGVIIYLYVDYYKFKNLTTTEYQQTETQFSQDLSTNTNNLAYVIDNVNYVNNDISGRITDVSNTNSNLAQNSSNLVNNINNAIQGVFTPGYIGSNTNTKFMNHVTTVSGFNANSLSTSNIAQFCDSTGNTCIKFPDSNGFTYITTLSQNSDIVMDAPTVFTTDVGIFDKTEGVSSLYVLGVAGNTNPYGNIQTNGLFLSDTTVLPPTTINSTLQIAGTVGKNALQVGIDKSTPSIVVDGNGNVTINATNISFAGNVIVNGNSVGSQP